MSVGDRHDRLVQMLEPVVARIGFDLEEVAITRAGKRRVLRLVIDADGGVGLDDITSVSEAVSAALDSSDVMGDAPYVLEVTSPGVERPLTQPRHWRRATGRLVRAQMNDSGEVLGRVVSADESSVVFDVGGDQREYALAELERGNVQVEFRRGDGDKAEGGASWT